jgi:hypothetical protein
MQEAISNLLSALELEICEVQRSGITILDNSHQNS